MGIKRRGKKPPTVPAPLREGKTPPNRARQLSGFVSRHWPSLSSYSQGGVPPWEGMSGAEASSEGDFNFVRKFDKLKLPPGVIALTH